MRQRIVESYTDSYPELLFIDGLDDAIIGVSILASGNPRVAYSADKILKCLVLQGKNAEEALEFLEFNIEGVCRSKYTPTVVDDLFY
tara:strand:- start:129 stop:389 length:261 start_codon:yes stop_codon:yes gene_type:complete